MLIQTLNNIMYSFKLQRDIEGVFAPGHRHAPAGQGEAKLTDLTCGIEGKLRKRGSIQCSMQCLETTMQERGVRPAEFRPRYIPLPLGLCSTTNFFLTPVHQIMNHRHQKYRQH